MGAPRGNKNAAGPHKKGWYRKSGSIRHLKKQMDKYTRARRSLARQTPFAKKKRMYKSEYHWDW